MGTLTVPVMCRHGEQPEEDSSCDPPNNNVSVGEFLENALDMEPARWTRGDQMRVSAYLKVRKWEWYKSLGLRHPRMALPQAGLGGGLKCWGSLRGSFCRGRAGS